MKRLDSTIETRNFDGRRDGRGPRRRSRRKRGGRSSNSYLGVGRSLGSDRDRQRLQDRNAAERSRVERMLAEGPVPTQPPAHWADSHLRVSSSPPSPSGLRALPSALGRACPVCTSRKIVSDEVADYRATGRPMGGTLRLCECLHCDHRWTERKHGRWSELGQRMSDSGKRSQDADSAPLTAAGIVRPAAAAH